MHDKSYLPDEPGFWEASWYGPGEGEYAVVDVGGARTGVLVCTEMWFLEHARGLGRAGAQLIATPRCTPVETLDKWLAGGRTCAVVSGAWSLSSNSAEPEHGGLGWVIDPEGDVVAVTSSERPRVHRRPGPPASRRGQVALPAVRARARRPRAEPAEVIVSRSMSLGPFADLPATSTPQEPGEGLI
jgi:N-carbamoylputrescine amidase